MPINKEYVPIDNQPTIKPRTVTGIFTRYIAKTLPLAFDESMSYYECLCALLEYINTKVIPALDNNAAGLLELQEFYEKLQTYVNNYFKNLDVQEEINNKLDEMAESGQLTDIIAQYLGLAGMFVFNTVADMKLAENLVNGSKCKTFGYHSLNDEGGALYYIRAITNEDVVDEGKIIALYDQNLIAEMIIEDYVNVKQFGAKGDDLTNDTQAFTKAINSVSNGGIVYIPEGHYLLDQITIPKNVTLKANHGTIPYNITQWYNPSDQDIDDITCLLRKNTNDENMIICYGFMENICIDGNNKTGNAVLMLGGFYYLVVTRAEKAVRLYTDGYGDGTHTSNSNNYDLEHLYLMGNLGDALTLTGADMRLQHFNIASNKGNGLTLTETAGTIYLNEGKIEWNGKNNVYSNVYAQEVIFNNCILDGANWYNFYNQSGGDFTFENCMIKGGRRDDTYNNTVAITSNTVLSQIYVGYSTTNLIFNACYFRKENQWEGTEQITYIIGSDSMLNTLANLNFTACNMPGFDKDHIIYNIPPYHYYLVGCHFAGLTAVGSPAKGLMPVIPFTDTANSTSTIYSMDGATGYDYSKNQIVMNVYGNMRKIPTFSDYVTPVYLNTSVTGTSVTNAVTLPTAHGTYLITCVMGGNNSANYQYNAIFSIVYGSGILTEISKSSEITATHSGGTLQLTCSQTIYDGNLSIVKIG